MLRFLLLLSIIAYFANTEIVTERVSIVNQLNTSSPASPNKLVAQRFTDILPQVPLLYVMDDFVLPSNISTNVTMMQLTFTIVRLRSDTDPDSISVVLMYNNPRIEGPGEHFFTKTVRAPNNPPRWHNDSLGVPEHITLNITQGEACSVHSSVRFDIRNTTFLPRLTRLWIGFYATGARNFVDTPPYPENVVFWCMTNDTKQEGEATSVWYEADLSNAPYFFIDEANILGKGLNNWTNASMVEPLLGLKSVSLNMAWSMNLLGTAPSNLLEFIQSLGLSTIIAIALSGVVSVILLCWCTVCIYRRCVRCRWSKRLSRYFDKPSGSGGLDAYQLVSKQENRNNSTLYNNNNSDIILETSSESHNGVSLGTSNSASFLRSLANVPIKVRNHGDGDSEKID